MLRLWWNSADSLHHHVGWVDAGATDGPRLVLSKVLWVDGISQVNSALPIPYTPYYTINQCTCYGGRLGIVLRLPVTLGGFYPLERRLYSQIVDPWLLCRKHSHRCPMC